MDRKARFSVDTGSSCVIPEIERLNELFEDHRLFHSDFQIDNFIIARSGITPYGQYTQAVRELYKRYRGLREIHFKLREYDIEIKELKNKPETERNQLELDKKKSYKPEIVKNRRDTEREFKRFFSIAVSLKEKIGDISNGRRDGLDQEMWADSIKFTAAKDYMMYGRFSEKTIDILHCCPKDFRKKILKEISDKEKTVEWFLNYDYKIPNRELDCSKLLKKISLENSL